MSQEKGLKMLCTQNFKDRIALSYPLSEFPEIHRRMNEGDPGLIPLLQCSTSISFQLTDSHGNVPEGTLDELLRFGVTQIEKLNIYMQALNILQTSLDHCKMMATM
ncbi:MAG TPA: hypothetical protein VHF05_01430 [Candidatus Paceibacterota bacterium]|nr:hypothetical protein [Candidatus Paceibacterota bacterium]